ECGELHDVSSATPLFKDAVLQFVQSGHSEHIQIEGHAPRVKVTRLLKHVLAAAPELEVRRVEVRGRSGCSDFVGSVRLETATDTRVYDFVWCCRWRAEEEGWQDYFGLPDQIRAAREYDWRCFQVWTERA